MSTSLEDILNGSAPAKVTPAPQGAETQQPAPPEPEEDTSPQEPTQAATGDPEPSAPQAAPPAAPAEDSLDKKISAFQRKAEDETRKRQDYERRLQEAEKAVQERDAYIAQVRQWQAQQQKAAPQQEVDIYDPDQLTRYVQGLVANERAAMQENMLVQKVVTSQEFMRSRHEDYPEIETVFAEEMARLEAGGDFSLRQKMEADPFPARFAYDHGKRVMMMRDIGDDPASYKQRIIDEYIAQQAQQQPAALAPAVQMQAKPVPQPPKSLAGVPSTARNVSKQPWKGPTPLDQLLS